MVVEAIVVFVGRFAEAEMFREHTRELERFGNRY